MSRIGKQPIGIPQGVKVDIGQNGINIEGPKGKLNLNIPDGIKAEIVDNNISVTRLSDEKEYLMKHGLIRALINNMVIGVSEGFSKELEIIGVGFKAELSGKKLVLNLGFSHPVEYAIPEGITIEAPKATQLIIKGFDKQLVGEVAAEIRANYKPEPYKGKGIRYVGEYVRKKAGKTVA
ncbi:MAG: 50S ribosomal protein L6 [Candidatus Omnitrophica bacterium]|nr:50S ribosomal protein L6 [Candidatus Omnitrophota bacterium]